MPRLSAPERLRDFLDTATRIFIAKGYRRTQMADVTDALGLSSGAIYRYVESKEALFDTALRYAIDPEMDLQALSFPVGTPGEGETLANLRRELDRRGRFETLERALALETPADADAELTEIVEDLFDRLTRYGFAMNLIERCALDWPRLAVLWFEELRNELIQALGVLLEKRIASGHLRPVPDPVSFARLMIEVIVFLAVDAHDDPFPIPIHPEVARETTLAVLLRSLSRREP